MGHCWNSFCGGLSWFDVLCWNSLGNSTSLIGVFTSLCICSLVSALGWVWVLERERESSNREIENLKYDNSNMRLKSLKINFQMKGMIFGFN